MIERPPVVGALNDESDVTKGPSCVKSCEAEVPTTPETVKCPRPEWMVESATGGDRQATAVSEDHDVERHERPETLTDIVASTGTKLSPTIVSSAPPEVGTLYEGAEVATGASYVNAATSVETTPATTTLPKSADPRPAYVVPQDTVVAELQAVEPHKLVPIRTDAVQSVDPRLSPAIVKMVPDDRAAFALGAVPPGPGRTDDTVGASKVNTAVVVLTTAPIVTNNDAAEPAPRPAGHETVEDDVHEVVAQRNTAELWSDWIAAEAVASYPPKLSPLIVRIVPPEAARFEVARFCAIEVILDASYVKPTEDVPTTAPTVTTGRMFPEVAEPSA